MQGEAARGGGALWYTDPARDGTWAGFQEVHGSPGPGPSPPGAGPSDESPPQAEPTEAEPSEAEPTEGEPSGSQPTDAGPSSAGVDPTADSHGDTPGSAGAPIVVADPAPGILVDTDGDGILDTGLTDSDGDGVLDTANAAGIRLRAGDWWEWGVTQR